MKFNKRSLIRWKVYFDRSRMYIGYVQFFLIGIVFIQSFKNEPWGDLIFKYALVSIPLLFIAFIFVSLSWAISTQSSAFARRKCATFLNPTR